MRLAATTMAIALVALAPGTAFAHGALKSSVPSSGAHLAQVPRELRLNFSESPELTFTSLRLLMVDGSEIPLGAIAYAADSRRAVVAPIVGAMAAGTYTVMWQMAGDDGHPIRGRFDFVIAPGAMGIGIVPAPVSSARPAGGAAGPSAVGGPSSGEMHQNPVSLPQGAGFGAESPLYVLIRWLQFMGLLLVIGACAFRFFVLGFMRREAHPDTELLADAERRAAGIGRWAAVVLAVVLVLRLGAQSYAMHGSAMFDLRLSAQMIRNTMWGWGWLIQLAGVLLAGAGFRGAQSAARRDENPRTWWRLAALGAVVGAFSPAFSGHAAAVPQLRALAIAADGIHILGASSWLGTLAIVLFAGLTATAQSPAAGRGAIVRDLIGAFSPVALASAAVAATTGVFAAWLHVAAIPNLWSTRYGVTLLVKLAVLGVVAGTGFYNWRYVKPRLGTDDATGHIRRSANVEVVVAVIVLLVTAVLVATPTPLDMEM